MISYTNMTNDSEYHEYSEHHACHLPDPALFVTFVLIRVIR